MDRRKKLDDALVAILDSDHVFFQPPSTVKMDYPCVTYSLDGMKILRADSINYKKFYRYRVVLMDWDPDTELVDKLVDIPYFSSMGQHYTNNNLHHWTFTFYV